MDDSANKLDVSTKEAVEKQPEAANDDIEVQKPASYGKSGGTNRIEAIQAVWGKYGKLLIISGYVEQCSFKKGQNDLNETV